MMMMMVMRVLVAGSSAVRSLSMQIMAWTGHGASLVVLGSHYSMGLVEKRRNRICIVAQWHATTHQPSTIPPPTIPTHDHQLSSATGFCHRCVRFCGTLMIILASLGW